MLIPISISAQQNDTVKINMAQVTFAYPIGSAGINSINYSNNVSINILYGFNNGVSGLEMGSLLNYNRGVVKGLQMSGILNLNRKNSTGFLLSGISNFCQDSTLGVFISGGFNYSEKNSKGLQLATVNIVASDFKGFQLGVFNYAKKLKGVQLGVINYVVDGKDGLPIGLFNIVKNGHFEFELTGGDVIYSNLNYKMGVEKFYTILKIGYSSFKNNPVYSSGIGFGGNISINEKQKISLDLSANNIIYNNNWDGDLNLLNKIDLNYKYNLTKKFTFLIGPSFNAYITEDKVNSEYGTLPIPYSVYTNEGKNNKLFLWVGINAGVSLNL